MCGISGIVAPWAGRNDQTFERLHRMGQAQRHRGPDAWGEWLAPGVALGHNRLTILDPEGGQQPMASPDGRYQLIYNGEVYNHAALRKQLAGMGFTFTSDHSDTEVVLNGYRAWGKTVFDRLEGMFAVALYDTVERELVLARDPLGIKPLHYALIADGLVFASELQTLLASGMVPAELCPEGLAGYFMQRAPIHPNTMVKAIRQLPPGTWMRYREGTGASEPFVYWKPRAHPVLKGSMSSLTDALEVRLERAVASHLVADVPVGVFLSGGVDSSLVAAFAARHARPDAYTLGTDSQMDERAYSGRVAAHLGLRLHVHVVTGEDYLGALDRWATTNDSPSADPSAIGMMLLAQRARQDGVKVMLSGDGADEVFGGYGAYRHYKRVSQLARLPFSTALGRRLGPYASSAGRDYLQRLDRLRYLGTAHISTDEQRQRFFVPAMQSWFDAADARLTALHPSRGSDLRAAMLFDQRTRLPDDSLQRTDRATMAHSVEARVPFLDRDVVAFANALPDWACMSGQRHGAKRLLKKLAARHVPHDVVYRTKVGFDLPLAVWFADEFRPMIQTFLRERRIEWLAYGDWERAYANGEATPAMLWAWIVLERWNRYVTGIVGQAQTMRPTLRVVGGEH